MLPLNEFTLDTLHTNGKSMLMAILVTIGIMLTKLWKGNVHYEDACEGRRGKLSCVLNPGTR
jgi:hypothetical protein